MKDVRLTLQLTQLSLCQLLALCIFCLALLPLFVFGVKQSMLDFLQLVLQRVVVGIRNG